MGEHHERETTVSDKGLGPHIVRAVKSRADLVQVVTSTHAPLPIVSVDHVGDIVELSRVAFSLGGLSSIGTVVWGSGSNVITISTIGRLETHVVVARLIVLAETELGSGSQEGVATGLIIEKEN